MRKTTFLTTEFLMTHSFVQKPKVRAGFPSPFKAGGQVGMEWQEGPDDRGLAARIVQWQQNKSSLSVSSS